MKKRIIQILLALSLSFYKSFFSDSAFDGKWSSFISGHLSTSFCRKENFSFQVAAEVLYLPFTGLHHFVYVGLLLVLFHTLDFKSNLFE